MENRNDFVDRNMRKLYDSGTAGHTFVRPWTPQEVAGFEDWWKRGQMHGRPIIFRDEQNRGIGAFINRCSCDECVGKLIFWTIETGLEMHAQAKGDYTYTRTSHKEGLATPRKQPSVVDQRKERQRLIAETDRAMGIDAGSLITGANWDNPNWK